MRIALATSSYAPYVGGVEEHVRNVARILREHGHDVVVWTVARDRRFHVETVDGIRVWHLPSPLPARSIAGLIQSAIRTPRAARYWRRAFRAHRPDVIHVHCFGPNGTYARMLCKWLRRPMILTTHGETIADDSAVFTRSRFASWSLRRAVAAAAAVTGCSQVTLDDLSARFGLKLGTGTVVFNGIAPLEAVGTSPAGATGRYIAAVGRIQPIKGFDLLIDAFARASLPSDVRLVIGGGGPTVDDLCKQAERLGVADRVVLPGWLDRNAVAALLRDAEAGVVPSRFEAFGITVLELWRAATPVIATTHGGPPEFIRDEIDGLLVDPENTEELAHALQRILSDTELAQSIAQEGAHRVESFSWDHTVAAYESLYAGVVDSNSL